MINSNVKPILRAPKAKKMSTAKRTDTRIYCHVSMHAVFKIAILKELLSPAKKLRIRGYLHIEIFSFQLIILAWPYLSIPVYQVATIQMPILSEVQVEAMPISHVKDPFHTR